MGKQSRKKRARHGRLGNRPLGASVVVQRLEGHLRELKTDLPTALVNVSIFVENRDRFIPGMRELGHLNFAWPPWVWIPVAMAFTAAQVSGSPNPALDASRVAALSTWIQTKTIYRIDPDLARSLLATSLPENLPTKAFRNLPEWCIYVSLPDLPEFEHLQGFYAHLDWEGDVGRPELRFLMDGRLDGEMEGLWPFNFFLDRDTISQALADMDVEARQAEVTGRNSDVRTSLKELDEETEHHVAVHRQRFELMAPFLLYLLSKDPDIVDPDRPKDDAQHRPSGNRPPADNQQPTVWEVGYRFGTALRSKELSDATRSDVDSSSPEAAPGARSSPRPHVRSAHWHHYWTGPRSNDADRQLVVHWLPPTIIGDRDAIVPTVRPVKG